MAPEREFGLDPRLDGAEAQLFQAPRLELQWERAGYVGVRVTTPERERCAEQSRGVGGIGLQERSRTLDRSLELDGVHVLWIDYELVATLVADDDIADRCPEIRDVRL